MNPNIPKFYKWKTVLITGSTGFKWSWLAFWLHKLWANVVGFWLKPATSPNLFSILKLDNKITQIFGDVNIINSLHNVCKKYKPEIIFHLAAQPLVKEWYKNPLYTFTTNAIGTINILELIRKYDFIKWGVMITTDKVYENLEWMYPYRETDRLAWHDPYSASKAMAELAIQSYQQWFFANHEKKIVSARAGNVFWWGDWQKDRLIPNFIRAIKQNAVIYINPKSVRPWQHVLEPLHWYMTAWMKMFEDDTLIGSYNFGPDFSDNLTVKEIVDISISLNNAWKYENYPEHMKWVHEARLLLLDNTKAKTMLHWYPKLSVTEWLKMTYEWHKRYEDNEDMVLFTEQQIELFTNYDK